MPSTPIRRHQQSPKSLFTGVSLETRLQGSRRIEAVDVVRGIAAVLMALETTRFYFSEAAVSPTDLTSRPTLFFTTLLTSFAAPIFVLLAGAGVFFRVISGQPKRKVSHFLIARGLLLIVLDLTIVPLVTWFNYDPNHLVTGPLWAIGWSMLALAGLLYFRVGTVAGIGVAIVFLHNLLDGVKSDDLGIFGGLWMILHEPGPVRILPETVLNISWPVLPWIGMICCGYAIGELYRLPNAMRPTMLIALGANVLVTFLILRGLNFYGDPAAWSAQETRMQTVVSFLNCARAPASLCHLLLASAPGLVLLGIFDGGVSKRWQRLATFGSVPLYFYLLHIVVIHLLAIGITMFRGWPVSWLLHLPDETGRGAGWQAEYGVELALVYPITLLALAALYPGCYRYAKLKFLRRPRWASYF
jgi:uncharacterized membrane protein